MKLKFDKNKFYVICGHVFPDCDAVGSSLGLYYWLKYNKIKAEILLERNENTIKQIDYNEFIATKEKIKKIKNKKFSLIALDSSTIERVYPEELIDYAQEVINIDHHEQSNFGNINIVDELACSCSEVLFYLLNGFIPRKSLDYFYAGVISDSINFTTSKVSEKTFSMAKKCIEQNVQTHTIADKINNNFSLNQLKVLEKSIKECTLTKAGVLFSHVDANFLLEHKLSVDMCKCIIPSLSRLNDAKIIVQSVAKYNNKRQGEINIYFSIRSQGDVDSLSISKKYDGGGHKNASGFSLRLSVDKYKSFDIIEKEIIGDCEDLLKNRNEVNLE